MRYTFLRKCILWLLAVSSFIFMPAKARGHVWDGLFRLGAFLPTSQQTRKIYPDAWNQYQLEASYNFTCNWSVWGNVAYSIIDSHLVDSRLQLYPIGLGLKYTEDLYCGLKGYVGAGAAFSFLHLDNDLEVENHLRDPFKIAKKALGGIVKSGLSYYYHEAAFVELFADYYYTQFHTDRSDHLFRRGRLDMSAFFIGAGVGASF